VKGYAELLRTAGGMKHRFRTHIPVCGSQGIQESFRFFENFHARGAAQEVLLGFAIFIHRKSVQKIELSQFRIVFGTSSYS
jgi:hypothetical protein